MMNRENKTNVFSEAGFTDKALFMMKNCVQINDSY